MFLFRQFLKDEYFIEFYDNGASIAVIAYDTNAIFVEEGIHGECSFCEFNFSRFGI